MKTIEIGDKVVLKGTSVPVFYVNGIRTESLVYVTVVKIKCVWLDKNLSINSASIRSECLEKIKGV